MIIVNIKDGLGNQMFQYAALRGIAANNQTAGSVAGDECGKSFESCQQGDQARRMEMEGVGRVSPICSFQSPTICLYHIFCNNKRCKQL